MMLAYMNIENTHTFKNCCEAATGPRLLARRHSPPVLMAELPEVENSHAHLLTLSLDSEGRPPMVITTDTCPPSDEIGPLYSTSH